VQLLIEGDAFHGPTARLGQADKSKVIIDDQLAGKARAKHARFECASARSGARNHAKFACTGIEHPKIALVQARRMWL
jgi:hypothetical protein